VAEGICAAAVAGVVKTIAAAPIAHAEAMAHRENPPMRNLISIQPLEA
jgi:hypothetical protein